MPVQLFTNNAVSTLAVALGIGVLTLTVDTGDGALFPSPAGGDWFIVTLESGATREIVRVTARAGDVFTIVRAQEGTSDQSWSIGDSVELRTTTGWLDTVHTEDSLPAAGIGDVFGPGTSVDNRVVFFDGTSGKTIKDSGLFLSGSNTGDQIISDATISITDITTNNFDTTKHGFTPKGPNIGQFLKDDGTWDDPSAPGALPEAFINGSMAIDQRVGPYTSVATASYILDRWRVDYITSTGVIDISQQNVDGSALQILMGQRIQEALRVAVTTADATLAAGEFLILQHAIEGNRAVPYIHNEFTVSFAVRASSAATYSLVIRNSGNDKSYLKTFTIDAADTWERKEITVPVQDTTGTWDYSTGIGLNFGISLAAGTSFHGTDDTWNSANNIGVLGQDNFLATVLDTIDMTGFQLDLGPRALPYRGMPFEEDYQDAMRYYQKSYDLVDAPGALVVDGELSFRCIGTAHVEPLEFLVPMRVPPTITAHNSNNTGNDWRDETAGADVAVTFNVTGEKRTVVGVTSTDTNQVTGHWEADAEL